MDDRLEGDFDALEDEAFPPLPPPQSPGEGEAATQGGDPFGDAEDGEVSKLADVPAAKRKTVKRPQPKLDSQRLISDRGLPALRTLFSDARFKGKGHEAEDLRLLMQRMENWAHRLYPKLQFEDFMERVEKLGGKKEVQTCLKRIRLDMPLTDEDFMDTEGVEEPPPDPDPDPFISQTSFSDPPGLIHSTPALAPPPTPVLAPPTLTEEQRRRMELNRQRALERRLARRQQTDPSDSQSVTAPSSGTDPTAVSMATGHSDTAEQLQDELEDLDWPGGSEPPAESARVETESPELDQDPGEHLDRDQPSSPPPPLPDLNQNPGEHLDQDQPSSTPPPELPAELPVQPSVEFAPGSTSELGSADQEKPEDPEPPASARTGLAEPVPAEDEPEP